MASFIYKNISFYRAAMQVLYKGKYRQRFDPVKKLLLEKNCDSVVEICFGDTIIAEFCKEHQIRWKGMDANPSFVARAQKNGFQADLEQIHHHSVFPTCDAVVMMGSLYHFEKDSMPLVLSLLSSTRVLILNEPIKNLSQKKMTRALAARLSDSGKGPESFRFSKESLLQLANEITQLVPFSFYIAEEGNKDITLVFERK